MTEWSREEEKILKKHYSSLGSKVLQFLPNRTLNSIDKKTRSMGLKFTGGHPEEGISGYLDIETSGLQADFGFMYTWFIKTANKDEYYSGQITRQEIHDGSLDRRITNELIETLKKYKRVYTYYGTNFDIPFIRTRALYHKIDFVPYGLVEHKDIFYMAKRQLRIHSKRLESVCDLLGIQGKTHLKPRYWIMANCGNTEAIEYISEHNKFDVIILEKVHQVLQQYQGNTRKFI